MSEIIVDFHCHPTMKPFGRSFENKGEHHLSLKKKNNIWHRDRAGFFEKVVERVATITPFTQSDFSSLTMGNVRTICCALYPPEKGFFDNKLGTGHLSDHTTNLVTGLGERRINFIQKNKSYFKDLINEYAFLKKLDGKIFTLDNQKWKYKIAKNYNDIRAAKEDKTCNTIIVIASIEGAHRFDCGIDPQKNPANNRTAAILKMVDEVKAWEHKPMFITFTHHFYNELSGHAPSLTGMIGSAFNQIKGINTGITALGYQVIDRLLDNSNGKRILIDIKHLSAKARQDYFKHLEKNYKNEDIPLLVSHGAVTGLKKSGSKEEMIKGASNQFRAEDINFYDEEILRIQSSGGLFCLQTDERRIASTATLKQVNGAVLSGKVKKKSAQLVWNQIRHIAELLDAHGQFAWGIQALGTDYDGIINPIEGYLAADDLADLDPYLQIHAEKYMSGPNKMKNSFNKIDPEEIVDRVLNVNALTFLQKHFI